MNEVMSASEEIERLAVARASANDIRNVALADGMVTLRDDGLIKAAAGHTTVEEVIRVSV